MEHIYSKFLSGPDDVSGALAYAAYKRSKIEWRTQFHAVHARQPSSAEEQAFMNMQMLPENILCLKQRGGRLAAQFIRKAVRERLAGLAVEVNQAEFSKKLLALEVHFASDLQQIQRQLSEKKTIGGWMKDIGTAFVSSVALVAIVGVILTGYVGLAKLTASTEKAVGLRTAPADKPASANPVAPPSLPQEGD